MSYWTASNKTPALQRSVRIPAENGTDYIAGQEIRIRIDPSIQYFNPEQTFLEAKVKIIPPTYSASGTDKLPCPTKLQLDAETGFQSLCRRINIHTENGVLLEEIENYNTMVSIKYDYETNDSVANKRALTEGCTAYDSSNRGSTGTYKSVCNTAEQNPYFENQTGAVLNASWTANNFKDAKVTIPLNTGIFGGIGNNIKLFPNGLVPIIITILLEDNNRVFRQLDGAMRYRKLPLNPMFTGGKAGIGTSIPDNGSTDTFYFSTRNAVGGAVQRFPFTVGEKLGFQRWVEGNASVVAFKNASGLPVIKLIEKDTKKTKVILNASVEIDGKGISAASETFAFSNSVLDADNYDVTYKVSDVNLIVQEVIPTEADRKRMDDEMKANGRMNYDFMSVTTYKYSQMKTDRVSNIRIPINNQRCKAVIACSTDASVYSTKQILNASDTFNQIDETKLKASRLDYYLRSNRSGLEGCTNEISAVQWLYDGRLQPSRRIPLTKTSSTLAISGQHLIELEKCLSQCGMTGISFKKFNKNFIIGRALALGDAAYDARNKDFNLQCYYETANAPPKNLLWMVFVYHIRRLIISNDSVMVEV